MSDTHSAHHCPEMELFDPADDPQSLVSRRTRGGSIESFRFIQASDFRLDTPCFGVVDLPASVRDRLVEARYRAAVRVFDAAIEHEVDFVVLAGGLLDPDLPGLRGPLLLAEQFRRMASHSIDVFWAGSTFETEGRWPTHVDLPQNVHRLTSDNPTGLLHGRHNQPIARLLAISSDTTIVHDGGCFTIAVHPLCESIPEQFSTGIDYWALGGQSEQETAQVGDVVAHYSGSPQGRSPGEIGRHSCTLVNVSGEGHVTIQPLPTDIVRWHHQRITIDHDTASTDIQALLLDRQKELHTDDTVELHLMDWTLVGGGLAVQRLMQPRFNRELVSRLNEATASREPLFWTLAIDALVNSSQRCDWQERESPLGVFLRELDDLRLGVDGRFGTSEPVEGVQEVAQHQTHAQLVQQVVNEGVHRLGTGEVCLQAGG